MTIHAIAHLSSEKQSQNSTMLNLLEGKFWSKVAYKIDSYSFSLDDIEHGILRCNHKFSIKNLEKYILFHTLKFAQIYLTTHLLQL